MRLAVGLAFPLGRRFSFPSTTVLAIPRNCDRACWPPLGFATVYEDSLIAGLRVPFPSIYTGIQEKYGVPAAQLYPNGVLQITGLGVASHHLGLPFIVDAFSTMFQFKAKSRTSKIDIYISFFIIIIFFLSMAPCNPLGKRAK